MADIRKAQQQLSRFLASHPEWTTAGTMAGLATFAARDGVRPGVHYGISFASYAELWRSDVLINGQHVSPPKAMRSGGFYATPAQAAKGCEAMERSQYTAR